MLALEPSSPEQESDDGDGADLFGAAAPGWENCQGDVMEKCMKVLELSLVRHWHVFHEGARFALGVLVHSSHILHILDDEDWVNDLYDLPDADVYSKWVLHVLFKEEVTHAHPTVCRHVQQCLASDFCGDLDGLVLGSAPQMLRIRILIGKYSSTVHVLNHILQKIRLCNMSLPSTLPRPLPMEAVGRIRAFMNASRSVTFHNAPPNTTEKVLKELLRRHVSELVPHVTRIQVVFQNSHEGRPREDSGGGAVACEFHSALYAAKALRKLDGLQLGGRLLRARRCF
jgi:hypothetical protein